MKRVNVDLVRRLKTVLDSVSNDERDHDRNQQQTKIDGTEARDQPGTAIAKQLLRLRIRTAVFDSDRRRQLQSRDGLLNRGYSGARVDPFQSSGYVGVPLQVLSYNLGLTWRFR